MTTRHPDRRLSVAPMMDWTTRDFRYLARLITRHTLLYTEMVTAHALLNGDPERLLGHHDSEHPLALQLGGSDPTLLARACERAADFRFDEINLNVGCPSDRVQNGSFGACLMAEPALVAECVSAMQQATAAPVTVKTRIGIDDQDQYEFLFRFIESVRAAGCRSFTIHARKAILTGLSPKENREIPPLVYDRAYQVKKDFPDCEIILNGGVRCLDEVAAHLHQVDGVMIGREAYQNPWFLSDADSHVFGHQASAPERVAVCHAYAEYVAQRHAQGHHPKHALRHVLNLFQGVPGARAFRRHLSESMHRQDTQPTILLDALKHIQV